MDQWSDAPGWEWLWGRGASPTRSAAGSPAFTDDRQMVCAPDCHSVGRVEVDGGAAGQGRGVRVPTAWRRQCEFIHWPPSAQFPQPSTRVPDSRVLPHPATVQQITPDGKPSDLMRQLAPPMVLRWVTIDPFAGSGSTGVGALAQGPSRDPLLSACRSTQRSPAVAGVAAGGAPTEGRAGAGDRCFGVPNDHDPPPCGLSSPPRGSQRAPARRARAGCRWRSPRRPSVGTEAGGPGTAPSRYKWSAPRSTPSRATARAPSPRGCGQRVDRGVRVRAGRRVGRLADAATAARGASTTGPRSPGEADALAAPGARRMAPKRATTHRTLSPSRSTARNARRTHPRHPHQIR